MDRLRIHLCASAVLWLCCYALVVAAEVSITAPYLLSGCVLLVSHCDSLIRLFHGHSLVHMAVLELHLEVVWDLNLLAVLGLRVCNQRCVIIVGLLHLSCAFTTPPSLPLIASLLSSRLTVTDAAWYCAFSCASAVLWLCCCALVVAIEVSITALHRITALRLLSGCVFIASRCHYLFLVCHAHSLVRILFSHVTVLYHVCPLLAMDLCLF